jgi:hypothetical protein
VLTKQHVAEQGGEPVQRDSVMFRIEGVDGAEPRLVARPELIEIFAGMAQSDLLIAHRDLMEIFTEPIENGHYTTMDAGDLLKLLEIHTRAVNALQGLMALREPDELVEAHMS